jgi:RNA polymerase sigma-70 factor (ECF subfamily)
MSELAQTILSAGRAAWPTVELSADTIATHIERFRELSATHAADLYLACACAEGSTEAVRIFERQFLAAVADYVRRFDARPAFADEVRQILAERLLASRPPKIGEYAGRGALGGWIRVAAVRVAIDLQRKSGVMPRERGDFPELAAGFVAPEAALLRERHKAAFEAAFRRAMQSLAAKQRTLLKLQIVDGLGIDELGALHRVHRATCARWLEAARQQLFDETYRELHGALKLSPSEFGSLRAAVMSEIAVSLTALEAEG